VARLDSGVPARDALERAYARRTEICPSSGWRRPPFWTSKADLAAPDSMAPQPPFTKNETLRSDVNIPGERDRRYWPPLSKGLPVFPLRLRVALRGVVTVARYIKSIN